MGFGMLGCQCCPSCEAIYPESDGPDTGSFSGIVYQHISNPAKKAFRTTTETSSFSPDPLINSLSFALAPYVFGGTSASIFAVWVTPAAPATAYADVKFYKNSSTLLYSFTDPTFPEGEWTLTITPTSATTATIDYVCGTETHSHSDTAFNMPDAKWCDLVGVTSKSGGVSLGYTDWITETL